MAALNDTITQLNNLTPLNSEGSWIALEISPQDFLLSHMTHTVEQNSARVVCVFPYWEEETSKTLLLVKIDLEDASNVIRSLERFDYTVRYCFQRKAITDETARERLDELMYYLEM
ncbi:hypothetical protein LJC06_01860 [Bacteroidales bacterium OttesenSCG-928-I14]|nr:hypothetical protein [Bacteroidales bacterium OttesenSCG-928-I14]